MKRAPLLAAPLGALVATLAACGAAPGLAEPGLPSFYTPGRNAPPAAAAADAGDPGPEASGPGHAPPPAQQPAGTWLDDGAPVAGPAARNAESGGRLDLGVVDGAPEGGVRVAGPTHGIQPTESGRLYILELYQQVLDERDALQREVLALTADLEAAHAENARLSGDASGEHGRAAALEQENAALRAELQDLAARLATAQIRRLEAEKVLLESRIELERGALDADAARTARNDP